MLAVVLLLLAQIPCAANDLTVVCNCKQGAVGACDTLRLSEPQVAAEIEAAVQAAAAAQGAQKAIEAIRAEGETSPASPEPPDCKGQIAPRHLPAHRQGVGGTQSAQRTLHAEGPTVRHPGRG